MSTPSLDLPAIIEPAHALDRQRPLELGERDRLVRRAKALSWLSLAYMSVEGGVAVTAAILSSSVALLGFGLDSAIEGLASIIVIWRFTGTRRLSEHAEHRAHVLALNEGRQTWHGEGCCTVSPLPGFRWDAAKERFGPRNLDADDGDDYNNGHVRDLAALLRKGPPF